MAYRFPKSLSLLDAYLQAKGHDTSKLSSDRHALDLLRRATGWRIKFPKKGKTCYTHLRRVHEQLFPLVPLKKAPAKARRVRGIGTTGPASDCRTVSQTTWNEISELHNSESESHVLEERKRA